MTEPATILGPDGRPLPRRPITAEVATPQISGVRSVWTQPVAAGLSPERLARILRDAAEPGGDTRDYLTLAEEIEEREPHYRAVLTTPTPCGRWSRRRRSARASSTSPTGSPRAIRWSS